MTWGRPIFSSRETKPALVPTVGPQTAMAQTIAEYLRCAVFRVAGDGGPDRDFVLSRVFSEWPGRKSLPYPCASVVERTDTFHEERFTPRPLEETLGEFDCLLGYATDPEFPKTVLWCTAEATGEYQIDFWTSAPADRQAIEARLGYLFNPGQERTGVLLDGHPKYYGRRIRLTLLSSRLIDEEETVFPNERRLLVNVQAQVDVVDLRVAVLLTPRATVEATDPNDSPP